MFFMHSISYLYVTLEVMICCNQVYFKTPLYAGVISNYFDSKNSWGTKDYSSKKVA